MAQLMYQNVSQIDGRVSVPKKNRGCLPVGKRVISCIELNEAWVSFTRNYILAESAARVSIPYQDIKGTSVSNVSRMGYHQPISLSMQQPIGEVAGKF
jgi:hypothetical protein